MTTSAPNLASNLGLPPAFSQSCAKWPEFPVNLGSRATGINASRLEQYQKDLDTVEASLFLESETEVEEIVIASKKDPKSRFIYIHAANARDRLRVRRSMFTMILSFHQVMPEYLDFLPSFGRQSTPRDIRFSGFRQQVDLARPRPELAVEALARSGQQYQIAYNLKGVTLKDEGEWSIRNAAFYHRFDIETGHAVWIVTKGRTDVLDRYKEMTSKFGRPEDRAFGTTDECFVSSLAPHLLFCRWSTEDWRGYIRNLEEAVDRKALMAVLGPREQGYSPERYQAGDIRQMQIWEEQASEAIVVLDGNVAVMASLRRFYQRLAADRRFPCRRSCAGEIGDFANQLDTMVSDMRNNIERARALIKTTSDRRELIKQYRQDEEAGRMHRLNKNLEEEAIVVMIITLVTLVYLPATFVSTFFSTDIVKYQEDEYPDGKFSQLAMDRWLQVTLPLTLFTICAAWGAKKWASRKAAEADGEVR
ncbi:hypothetical protein C8A00DRAFT_44337 [Chaetomidium leptoderma]|uniref:CorA-like transporter domain-containing protein n=1 Tax=Chaetomidium leptoderma TaxID=669021 RepID=A0AAN6VJY1_9PEZI|nr:hypothetical protein C8A00DRAFT_44337 [Chaetomidium leptoderma]